jgi:hypothetical protein
MPKHTVTRKILIPSIDLIAALKTNGDLAAKERMPRVAERMHGFAAEVDLACSDAWQDCIDLDKLAGSHYTCEVVITAHLPELDED